MSRLIFFLQEAIRALRRNAAPSLAAIITTVVTVVLLGVLIPIFQTTQAKSDQIRGELNLQAALYPDVTKSETAETRETLLGVPHVAKVEYVTKEEALQELKQSLDAKKREELTSQLAVNPLPASFKVTPDDAANLAGIRDAIMGTGPGGQPQPIAPTISNIFERQDSTKKIEEVTSALKIVLSVITALLVLA